MVKQVSTEGRGKEWTSPRQDEKLRAIKDLKMPMARFMNGILNGQAEQFIPGTNIQKTQPILCGHWKLRYVKIFTVELVGCCWWQDFPSRKWQKTTYKTAFYIYPSRFMNLYLNNA